jgi:hypothetical protein
VWYLPGAAAAVYDGADTSWGRDRSVAAPLPHKYAMNRPASSTSVQLASDRAARP